MVPVDLGCPHIENVNACSRPASLRVALALAPAGAVPAMMRSIFFNGEILILIRLLDWESRVNMEQNEEKVRYMSKMFKREKGT
jgi:hypothetical protein